MHGPCIKGRILLDARILMEDALRRGKKVQGCGCLEPFPSPLLYSIARFVP